MYSMSVFIRVIISNVSKSRNKDIQCVYVRERERERETHRLIPVLELVRCDDGGNRGAAASLTRAPPPDAGLGREGRGAGFGTLMG